MQAHELRKLITTFLVLALLAGSASLAFTSLARQKGEGPAAATQQAQKQIPKIGDRAFVEDIATTRIEGYDLAAEFTPRTDVQGNYTDELAKGLAYNFVKANPEGPDLSGGTGVLLPNNLQDVVDQYVTDAALTPTTYAIDRSRLKIAKNYTQEQLDAYLGTLEETFSMASTTSGGMSAVMARSGSQPTPAAIEASNFLLAQAQEKLYNAVVPAPAQKLHEQALTYFELNRKLTDLDYTTDPLRAVVFTTKYPELLAYEGNRLQAEAEQLQYAALSSGAHKPLLLASLIGIPRANAGWPVVDFGHIVKTIINGIADYGTWGQLIMKELKSIALQILKNQIVGRLIQQTIKWVQGGGKPQFITNWKGFLKDSAVGAVNTLINKIEPKLCQNLRAFTTDFLRATAPNSVSGSRDPYQQFTCTLDQIVASVKDFYEDFRSGGWIGFATLILEPQNNAWGAIVVAGETAMHEAAGAKESASTNAESNRGYTGMRRCVNTEVLTVDEREASELRRDPNFRRLIRCYDGGDAYLQTCEVEMCKSDGWEQTTPGGAVADQVSKALGGTLDNVVNANDLAGLVAAVVDAAISRLTNLAVGGLLGLFNGDSGGSGGGSGNGTSTSGGGDDESSLASVRAQALQLATAHQGRASSVRNDISAWPGHASSTQPLLVSVGATCPALAETASQRLGAIDRIAPGVNNDGTAIGTVITQLASTTEAINTATSAMAISDLIGSLDIINSQVATLATRATTRNGQMQSLAQDARDNLKDRACNLPLTQLDE